MQTNERTVWTKRKEQCSFGVGPITLSGESLRGSPPEISTKLSAQHLPPSKKKSSARTSCCPKRHMELQPLSSAFSREKNSHIFRVEADLVVLNLRKKLHGNAKDGEFAIDYKLTADMQQMGNSISQIEILCGFLDLPFLSSLWSHIEKAKEVLGKVQI